MAGVALIAGILVGEGGMGSRSSPTRPRPLYWDGEIIMGVGVAVIATRHRVSDLRHLALGAVLTAIVATAFYVTYAGNLIALL